MGSVYREPARFLHNQETGLGDGMYRGAARIDGTLAQPSPRLCIPFSAAELARAPAASRPSMRAYNRRQRKLRVVVEQTFGMIKAWAIVGNTIYRANLDYQGRNFVLCTYLTARLMRVRDAYPRGNAWLESGLDAFTHVKEAFLEVDPLYPDLY